MKRKEWFQYCQWIVNEREIIKLQNIIKDFQPEHDHMDLLALEKVTGKQLMDAPDD